MEQACPCANHFPPSQSLNHGTMEPNTLAQASKSRKRGTGDVHYEMLTTNTQHHTAKGDTKRTGLKVAKGVLTICSSNSISIQHPCRFQSKWPLPTDLDAVPWNDDLALLQYLFLMEISDNGQVSTRY